MKPITFQDEEVVLLLDSIYGPNKAFPAFDKAVRVQEKEKSESDTVNKKIVPTASRNESRKARELYFQIVNRGRMKQTA